MSTVLVNHDDAAIKILTLNRPEKRNALSVELIEKLAAEVDAAGHDPNCRVLILRGAGPAFCAGLDLAEAAVPERAERSAEALAWLYEAVRESPLVTIAAAQGGAFGGGAGLLAACDFVVAADDLRLGYPEVHRGLIAALVTCLLARQLTDRQIRELILLGQTLPAPRALELGLVSRVAPAARLDEAVAELAREASRGAPGAIARSKRLLDELAPRPIRAQLRIALKYHMAARNSAEAAEGISAFREKREPRWGPRVVQDGNEAGSA